MESWGRWGDRPRQLVAERLRRTRKLKAPEKVGVGSS